MSSAASSRVSSVSRSAELALPTFVSALGTLIALFPSNPNNMTLPSRDSGVFLYMGWRLLNGDVPYRDVWDHKPPLIYFVDALGLALTPDLLWGIWAIRFLFIFFTFFFIYKLLDQEFGIFAALAGSITLTSGLLTILEKGNVTEEYALVFQAVSFWLFVHAWRRDFPLQSSFWVGVLGGCAFNFKQTTIGIWITYGLFLLVIRLVQKRLPVKDLLSLLGGWLLPSIVIVLYLASQGAFIEYWEQAFLYSSRVLPISKTVGCSIWLSLVGWQRSVTPGLKDMIC